MTHLKLAGWLLALLIFTPGCSRAIEPCRADCTPIRSGEETLAAEIDLPPGPGPHPVLISVHGSGKVERHQFAGSGEFWNSMGVAFVRYDKRGVGQSTGSYRDVGAGNSAEVFDELADDVAAVVDFVAASPEIDLDRIGLIGASQAGWIMPLAAGRSPEIDFIVSISGATSSVGLSDYFDSIAERVDNEAEIDVKLAAFDGEHGYDPAAALNNLEVPVLWLYGGRDQSNPTANDIEVIETIRSLTGADFTIELFPSGDHQLVHADTGEPFDTFLPIVVWMRQHSIIDNQR